MSDHLDLQSLRDGLHLPPTQVAETAWERARRRVARRRVAAGAGLAALVSAVALAPQLVGGGAPRGLDPTGPPPSLSSPTATVTGEGAVGPSLAPVSLDVEELDRLAGEAARVEGVEEVPLAESPIDHAVYAVAAANGDVLLLGPDRRYRRVETTRAAPTNLVQPTSLNPDATRLALALPDAVLAVDLATGATSTIGLPAGGEVSTGVGLQGWAGSTEVLVTNGDRASTIVDVETGTTTPWGPGGGTVVGPDGPVAWDRSQVQLGGRVLETGFDVLPGTTLAGDGFAVATASLRTGSRIEADSLPGSPNTSLVVVDLETADPLALLPLSASVAGLEPLELDEDEVVILVSYRGAPVVASWDWRGGQVRGLAQLGPFLVSETGQDLPAARGQEVVGPGVAWGVGWDEVATPS